MVKLPELAERGAFEEGGPISLRTTGALAALFAPNCSDCKPNEPIQRHSLVNDRNRCELSNRHMFRAVKLVKLENNHIH